jgi:hypothetical protein
MATYETRAWAQSSGAKVSESAAKLSKKSLAEYKEAVERRVREALLEKVDEFLSRRLERSSYVVDISVDIDQKKIQGELNNLQGADPSVLIRSTSTRRYEELRSYLSQVEISLSFSDKLSPAESAPVVKSLQSSLAIGDNAPEIVKTRTTKLPESTQERVFKMQALEAQKQQKTKELMESRLKQLEHELKIKELEHQHTLSKAKDKGPDKNEKPGSSPALGSTPSSPQNSEIDELKTQIIEERRKRLELSELLSKETLKERISREMPLVLRTSFAGGILAIGLLLASLIFGMQLVRSSRALALGIRQTFDKFGETLTKPGATGLGSLGMGGADKKEKNPREKAQGRKNDDPENPDDESNERNEKLAQDEQDLGLLKGIDEVVEDIREMVEQDLGITSALLSKLVEQKDFDRAFVLLDLCGPVLAKKVFATLSEQVQRNLKRRYYASDLKRTPLKKIFIQALGLRSQLFTSSVLIENETEKGLLRILLSHSDAELATALVAVKQDLALALLAWLPAERVILILRLLPADSGAELRRNLSRMVKENISLSEKDLAILLSCLQDATKRRFEEVTSYFKQMLREVDESEYNDIVKGLETDPRLCIAVTGTRATTEDLWAQPLDIIEKLFGELDLELVALFLYEAPVHVKTGLLGRVPERRKLMLEDSLQGLEGNEHHRIKKQQLLPPLRKEILKQLADLADAGTAELPSLKRLIKKMEDLEREKSAA